jgi:hypothetical protein
MGGEEKNSRKEKEKQKGNKNQQKKSPEFIQGFSSFCTILNQHFLAINRYKF